MDQVNVTRQHILNPVLVNCMRMAAADLHQLERLVCTQFRNLSRNALRQVGIAVLVNIFHTHMGSPVYAF